MPAGPVRPAGRVVRRVVWGALALCLAAFAVFESAKYGLWTTTATLAFFAVPDVFRRYRVARNGWIPLAVLVAYSAGPVAWPPLFTAGLGWLTRVVISRALGRG